MGVIFDEIKKHAIRRFAVKTVSSVTKPVLNYYNSTESVLERSAAVNNYLLFVSGRNTRSLCDTNGNAIYTFEHSIPLIGRPHSTLYYQGQAIAKLRMRRRHMSIFHLKCFDIHLNGNKLKPIKENMSLKDRYTFEHKQWTIEHNRLTESCLITDLLGNNIMKVKLPYDRNVRYVMELNDNKNLLMSTIVLVAIDLSCFSRYRLYRRNHPIRKMFSHSTPTRY